MKKENKPLYIDLTYVLEHNKKILETVTTAFMGEIDNISEDHTIEAIDSPKNMRLMRIAQSIQTTNKLIKTELMQLDN